MKNAVVMVGAAHAGVYSDLWEAPLKLEQVRQVQREARAGEIAAMPIVQQRPAKRQKASPPTSPVRPWPRPRA